MNYYPPFRIGCRKGDVQLENVNIILGDEVIGNAQITRCGLYLRFSCACDLPAGSMYRIWITEREEAINLGILSPQNGRFVLDKSIAANRIGHSEICLRVLPVSGKFSDRFMVLKTDAPFEHIAQLNVAKFGWDNGVAGIYIKDSLR